MKKIRKLLLTVVLLAICVCCVVPVAACGGGWQEVQSITYKTDSGTTTLSSKCFWDVTREEITQDEYDNILDENNKFTIPERNFYYIAYPQTIDNNRSEFIDNANRNINITNYYCIKYTSSYGYYKITYNSYTLNYVKIKFNSDNSIEINYDGETTKVLPLSYEVSYFED